MANTIWPRNRKEAVWRGKQRRWYKGGCEGRRVRGDSGAAQTGVAEGTDGNDLMAGEAKAVVGPLTVKKNVEAAVF